MLNLLFGELVFTSDNIAQYSPIQMQQFLSMFPHRDKTIHQVTNHNECYEIHFSIGNLQYLVLANLSNHPVTMQLDPGVYFCENIWLCSSASSPSSMILQARQSKCLLQVAEHEISIAGSTGHIFPGSEIQEFNAQNPEDVILRWHSQAQGSSSLYINIPDHISNFKIAGKIYSQDLHPLENLYLAKVVQ